MPRYFFHTRIGDALLTDEEGAELRDPDHAWRVAQATIRSSLGEDGADQARLLAASLVVTDEAGETVLEFPFAEAIEPPGRGSLH